MSQQTVTNSRSSKEYTQEANRTISYPRQIRETHYLHKFTRVGYDLTLRTCEMGMQLRSRSSSDVPDRSDTQCTEILPSEGLSLWTYNLTKNHLNSVEVASGRNCPRPNFCLKPERELLVQPTPPSRLGYAPVIWQHQIESKMRRQHRFQPIVDK